MRAYRYCEAMTTASAFGWYLFPPMTFSLMWDGRMDVLWTYEGADGWFPLKRAQFPNFAEHFDKVAPADVQRLLAALPRRLDRYRARPDPDLDRIGWREPRRTGAC